MGQKLVVRFSAMDIFNNTAHFKDHREYLQHLFKKEHNATITKWGWDMVDGNWIKQEDGCVFKRTDSTVDLAMEAHAELGVNARMLIDGK